MTYPYGAKLLFGHGYDSVFAKVPPRLAACSCPVSIFQVAICHMLTCNCSGSGRNSSILFSRPEGYPPNQDWFTLLWRWVPKPRSVSMMLYDLCFRKWTDNSNKAKTPLICVICVPPSNWIRKIMAFKIKSFQKYITQTQAWLQKPTQACHHQIERIILTQKLIYHMKFKLAKHTELNSFFFENMLLLAERKGEKPNRVFRNKWIITY